jgi:hypothetical protein
MDSGINVNRDNVMIPESLEIHFAANFILDLIKEEKSEEIKRMGRTKVMQLINKNLK